MSSRPEPLQRLKYEEATAANVISPKGISRKSPATEVEDSASKWKEVGRARRRLTVVSSNFDVDGVNRTDSEGEEDGAELELASQEAHNVVVSFAGVSKKGYAPYNPRKKNQDALLMHEHKQSQSLILCVFDGHGEAGDLVSQYFKKRFAGALITHPLFAASGDPMKDATNVQKAMKDSILALERTLLRDTDFSGTTAVLAVLRGDVLIVGNIGDSRITVVSESMGKVQGSAVSVDHKPELPEEKKRIIEAGGRVFAVEYDDGVDGPPRVWLGHMDVPGLAMSRSLGDEVAHTAGVSSEPEFFVRRLAPEDKYLVLASDGLWEFVSDQEVAEQIQSQQSVQTAIDLLIMEASSRWMKEEQVIDDTTVVVAQLQVPV